MYAAGRAPGGGLPRGPRPPLAPGDQVRGRERHRRGTPQPQSHPQPSGRDQVTGSIKHGHLTPGAPVGANTRHLRKRGPEMGRCQQEILAGFRLPDPRYPCPTPTDDGQPDLPSGGHAELPGRGQHDYLVRLTVHGGGACSRRHLVEQCREHRPDIFCSVRLRVVSIIRAKRGLMSVTSMALYYPWMHFQDESWLKISLLTWENLVRVRPRFIEDGDSDLVRRVRGETDFLVDIVPSQRDLATVADAFTGVIESQEASVSRTFNIDGSRHPDTAYIAPVSQRLGLSGKLHVSEDAIYSSPSDMGKMPDARLTWIYSGTGGSRMDQTLQRYLIDLGVAVAAPEGGPWVGMRPRLASVYMAALADAVAGHNDLAPTTDDPRMHSAVGAISQLKALLFSSEYRPAREEPVGAYVHLALQAVLEPKDLGTISAAKIIEFRQTHKDELKAFWRHVSSLADELDRASAVDNAELSHLHMQEIYQNQTKPMLQELQRGLLAYGVDTVAGSVALKVNLGAASGTAVGAAALAGGPVALGAASVALSVVPYIANKTRQVRARQRTSPVAYLLAANRKLSGKGLLQTLQGRS